MRILIFEDEKFDLLYPLSMLRAAYEVKTGAHSILENTLIKLGKNAARAELHCRKDLIPFMRAKQKLRVNDFSDSNYLLLNGRFVFGKKFLKHLASSECNGTYFKQGGSVAYAFVPSSMSGFLGQEPKNRNGIIDEFTLLSAGLKEAKAEPIEIAEISYPWDALSHFLSGGLTDDLKLLAKSASAKKLKANIVNSREVYCSQKASVSSASVLDASEGIIVINEGCVVEPFAYIKGPAYLGKNALVKAGTRIYGPCAIGKSSKVAGEIAESVFHSYVNKQHDGFVGHSYICPFVNLGADTVTSDLKNNYSAIKQKFRGGLIDTNMRFLGSIIGDHSKTSINTMLNTGTVAGIFSNIFGGGFPPKEIDSFSWVNTEGSVEKYDFDKAMATANIVMERRDVNLSEEYKTLAKSYFD